MGFKYDTTIGTLLVGIFLNTFLYGIVTYQFAAYYRMKFNDPPATRYMVLFLFVLDTFHSVALVYLAWNYTVTNHDDPAALALAEWPRTITPVATALTALVTQMFLGFRIWRLTNSRILYGIVVLLAIPSFILGIVCSIEAWIIRVLSEIHRITPLAIAWLSLQVVVDAFITTTLIIIFSRSRTGFHRTDTVLNRLIRGAIQTGFFPGVFSVGNLITFVFFPSTNLYFMFGVSVGRLYTNTLLDSLLIRESLREEIARTYDVNELTGVMGWARADSSQGSSTVQSASFQRDAPRTVQDTCDRSSTGDAEGKVVPLIV